MPKSTPEHVAALRTQAQARAGLKCEAPRCPSFGEELAHIYGRRMGGSAAEDRIDRVAWLCKYHHDVFDGRDMKGRQMLLRDLMFEWINR